MFSPGDLVVYGGEGVCRVEKIGPAGVPGAEKDRMYYTLSPLYRTGQVLTPVDTRVLIRPVIDRTEAEELVKALPDMDAEEPAAATNPRLLKEYYHDIVTSYDCRRQAELIGMIALRRRRAMSSGKKPSQMDERYGKRAEDQLYGELAAALGIRRGEVEEYIRRSCPTWPE